MQIRNFIWSILALACVACEVDGPLVTEQPAPHYQAVLRASQQAATRTSLGEGDGTAGSEQEIRWEVGDRLSVWAKKSGASAYTFEAATFQLATFNEVYSTADFMATIPAMTQGTYTYHAVYPVPESRTGTQVSYTLPATQSGQYDPALDVMAGTVTGNALASREGSEVAIPNHEPELSFSHLFHLVRIRIPEGKNLLGESVKRLDVIFPEKVVGTVTFDVTDPASAEWTNLSNKITVEFSDDHLLDSGTGYVWLFVKPSKMSGVLRVRAYGKSGVPSQEITTQLDKQLTPQHITPMALTIPASDENASIEVLFSCPDDNSFPNFLGEVATSMTVKTWPDGWMPTKATKTTLTSTNGTFSARFYYLNDEYYQHGGVSGGGTQSVSATFKTAHVDLSNRAYQFTLPSMSELAAATTAAGRTVKYALPYLFFEDFKSILNEEEYYGNNTYDAEDRHQSGVALSQLQGWSAARFWAKPSTIRLNARWQIAVWASSSHYGRLDTPPLDELQTSMPIAVVFNAGANKHSSSSATVDAINISFATHTNASNPLNGVGTGAAQSGSFADYGTTHYTSSSMSASFGAEDFNGNYPSHSVSVSSANSQTRLCFYPRISASAWWGTANAEINIYIDNIKVSVGSAVKHADLNYRTYFPDHTN